MKLASTYILSLYLLICCGPAQTDVSLRISPERSNFFKHESISLSCEEEGISPLDWSVKRHTRKGNGTCSEWGGVIKGRSCALVMYNWDSGVYWCQSKSGEVSRAISIAFHAGAVILESPVLPVTEGGNATLRCLSKDETTLMTSFDLPAEFYKDGTLIASQSPGQMTIHNVSKSDEGLYKCNISGVGASPGNRLEVNARASSAVAPRPPPLISTTRLILFLVTATPYVISTVLLVSIHRQRAGAAANGRRGRDMNDVIMEVAV